MIELRYVATIDQGTSGSRSAIFDECGRQISYSYREHRQIYPNPGWVEHDPAEILQNVRITFREALGASKVRPEEVEAIGLANQRESTILWNRRTGHPVSNAIVWQCRRTTSHVEDLVREGWSDTIRGKTGLVPDAYFSGTKIWWILDNVPGARKLAENGELLFGTVDSWITWNLTGRHVTDPSNASRTMIFNIRDMSWDEELLEIMGRIPESVLPEVRPSCDWEGYGSPGEGMGIDAPVCGVLGDQQAAAFGQCCFGPGEAKATYGTGNFVLMNTGRAAGTPGHGLLTTVAYQIGSEAPAYAMEGSIFVTGAALQWLRDSLGIVDRVGDAARMARSVSDTGGVLFIPAFAGLGAPHWEMNARGTMFGLTSATTKAHVVRAALEAACFRTREVVDAMELESGLRIPELKADGGGSRNDFTMQFQADLLGVPVRRPRITEMTSLGAAFAAGLAAGVWRDQEELRRLVEYQDTFRPAIERREADRLFGAWRRAVDSAVGYARARLG
jgi:glycerol kinase